MSNPQPKILSVITVPSGGWTFKIYLSNSSQYDTAITATMDAGDYFMAWDNQSSDFLYELASKLNAAVTADPNFTGEIVFWLDSNNKVNITFDHSGFQGTPSNNIKLAWTENDGSSIGAVLGFDTAADDTSTGTDNPTFTADYQHAYGWYANEDGQLENLLIEDIDEASAFQTVSPAGRVVTQYVASRFLNSLDLTFVQRARMFSADTGYGSSPPYPYSQNVGLQCFWKEARQGKRFRVYRDGTIRTAAAQDQGSITGVASSTVLTDGSKSWAIDPQERDNWLIYMENWGEFDSGDGDGAPMRWHIASHTATALTVSNAASPAYNFNANEDPNTYYLMDQRYETYVLDTERGKRFEPTEIPNIDRFMFSIPLRKYVS